MMAATPDPMPDIATLVPHSGQMVLLERVVSADADNLCAEVRIHAGSVLATEQGVGSWGGIEYMAVSYTHLTLPTIYSV